MPPLPKGRGTALAVEGYNRRPKRTAEIEPLYSFPQRGSERRKGAACATGSGKRKGKYMTLTEAIEKMRKHRILIGITDGEKSDKATALGMLIESAMREVRKEEKEQKKCQT